MALANHSPRPPLTRPSGKMKFNLLPRFAESEAALLDSNPGGDVWWSRPMGLLER